MKFRSDEDGYITALRFYKQANNTGTHVGHLWSGDRPAAGGRDLHERDRLGLADRRAPEPGRRSPRTRPTSPPTTRPSGYLRVRPAATSRRASTTPPMQRAGERPRRRQRRLPLRRQRLPGHDASTRPTTGSTRRSTAPCRPTRAARRSPRPRRRRRHRRRPRHRRSRRPSTSRSPPASVSARDVHAARRRRRARARRRELRRADADGAARCRRRRSPTRHDLHARRSRAAPSGVTDAAGNPLSRRPAPGPSRPRRSRRPRAPAARSSSSPSRADPFDALLRGDPARRGPQRVQHVADGPVTAQALTGNDARDPRRRLRSRTPRWRSLTNWVQAGGNLIAMRPDKKLAGAARAHRRRRHARERLHEGRPGQRRGRRDRRADAPVPRHGRPLHAERRERGRDAVLRRGHGDLEPGRVACATSAPAAARPRRSPTTSRARSSTRARATRPGRARSATARAERHPARTTSSTAPRPATSSPTGSTPTGSTSRRPTSSSACSPT